MKRIVFIFLFILTSCELLFPPSVYETLVENGLINPKKDIKAIYVSPAGNDAYPGTNKSEPVKTINIAIERAKQYGYENIYLQSADFLLNNGLNNPGVSITNISNIKLIGGFDNEFSKIIGQSFLNGGLPFSISNVINIQNSTNIELENLKISGISYSAINHDSIGIRIVSSSNIVIKNCNFYSNTANSSMIQSSALYVYYSSDIHILNSIFNKNTNNNGGTVRIISSSFCSLDKCELFENVSANILNVSTSTNIFITSKFYNNSNTYSSLIFLNINSNISISGEIYNNFHIPNDPSSLHFLSLENNNNSKVINLYMASNITFSPVSTTNYLTIKDELNLLIQNCTFIGFFGNSGYETAIYEQYTVANHRIINNKFRNISNLYYNYENTTYINNINELNDAPKTGAAEAYGNIVF